MLEWLISLAIIGGIWIVAIVLVEGYYYVQARMDRPKPPDQSQPAKTVSAARGPVQVNVKVIRYEQFHHRRLKGNV